MLIEKFCKDGPLSTTTAKRKQTADPSIESFAKRRLARALIVVFTDGFKSFKLFGSYHIWDFVCAVVTTTDTEYKKQQQTSRCHKKIIM